MIKLVVGLGNPGQQYEKTRHNAGFAFVDRLLENCGGRWNGAAQFHGEHATCSFAGSKLVLLKPMTFMNRSGLSVGSMLKYYKFEPAEMLVAHDELELPEGVVRLKRDGGHAGHNGLRDIIAHAGTRDFYRLRIGIGRPAQGENVADYVLSKPSKQFDRLLEEVADEVIKEFQMAITGDIESFNALDMAINKKS